MATQHSDPSREPTNRRSEVLSDATDLDVLLEAILGDEIAPVTPHRRPPADVIVPAVVAAARPEPTIAPPPLTRVNPEHDFGRATADDNDAWGFVSEDPQEPADIAPDFSAAQRPTPVLLAPSLSRRTWRDSLRVSSSKQSLTVAALLVAALITVSAIGLRDQLTATQTLPAQAPVSVPSSAVQPTSAVTPADPPVVEVWAAAQEPEEPQRVTSRTPPRRANEATNRRSSAPLQPTLVEAPRSAPLESPVVPAPAPVERVSEPTNRDAAPSANATPADVQRTLIDSGPAAATNAASVVNAAEPAPTAVAPPAPAARLPRTSARLLTGGAPEYPAALRTARIGGSVEVRFTIDPSGRVTNVQSVSGPLQLRAAAEAAVRRWRYEAARLDNVAVETQTSVRFNFEPAPDRRPQE